MSNGMKVNHDIQDLKEGEEIILTLKDQELLGDNGELIEEDILENRELAEQDRRTFLQKQSAKEAKNRTLEEKYNEFEKGNILSKYDKVENKKEGFKISEGGELLPDAKKQLEMIKQKLKMNPNSNIISSDNFNKSYNVVAREYEEETEEQKQKKKKGFQKRIKKLEKKQKTRLVDFLEENVEDKQQDHMENHGNREQQAALKKKEDYKQNLEEKKKKIENYEAAVDEANQLAKIAQRKWELEDDTEQQLLLSIENQRKYQQERQKQQENGNGNGNGNGKKNENYKNENSVLELLQENEEKEKEYERQKELEEQKIQDSKIAAPKKKLKKNQEYLDKISFHQGFLKSVDTKKAADNQIKMEQKQTSSLNETKNGTTSIVQVSLPSERQMGRYKKQEELDNQVPDMSIQLTQEEIDKLKEENEFLFEKKRGVGLADTLKALREKGTLLQSNYDYRGRNLDEKPHEERLANMYNDPNDVIKLEHRDKTGRLMTKKEAFRYQSQIFHGQGPSKKTQEKQMRKEIQRETTRQKISNMDTGLQQQFKNYQKSAQNPYMKL